MNEHECTKTDVYLYCVIRKSRIFEPKCRWIRMKFAKSSLNESMYEWRNKNMYVVTPLVFCVGLPLKYTKKHPVETYFWTIYSFFLYLLRNGGQLRSSKVNKRGLSVWKYCIYRSVWVSFKCVWTRSLLSFWTRSKTIKSWTKKL